MSGIGKHNVRTYLEACGKYQKYENSCEIEELTQLMEGYAQLYHNNQKKANGDDKTQEKALHKHIVSLVELSGTAVCGVCERNPMPYKDMICEECIDKCMITPPPTES